VGCVAVAMLCQLSLLRWRSSIGASKIQTDPTARRKDQRPGRSTPPEEQYNTQTRRCR
jgi:hypothetical protein